MKGKLTDSEKQR